MAIPMAKTIGEIFALSHFKSCKGVYDYLEANHPGWTEDTVIDVLTYTEGLRALNQSANAAYGIYNGLSNANQRIFVNWALNQFISHTPNAYPKKNDLIALKDALADYIQSPTAPKRNALLATAKALKPETNVDAEIFVLNAFKGITVAIANNLVNGEVLRELARNLARAGQKLSNLTIQEIHGAILTKLQQIIGVRD